jgi:hypothetical protein
MPLTVADFDDIYLQGKATFDAWLGDFTRATFEPIALDAFAQQVRQLPAPVQAELKRKAPQAWQRLFGE